MHRRAAVRPFDAFPRPCHDRNVADPILLVEDDKKLAPLVQRFLEDHHFEVFWSVDGDDG